MTIRPYGNLGRRTRLTAFVGGGFREGDEVEHRPEAGADAVAVKLLELGCGKIGGCVGDDAMIDLEVVAMK